MRRLALWGILLGSIAQAHAEPGDPRYGLDFSSQMASHRAGSLAQTSGTVVGSRSRACVTATGGHRTCGCELSLKLFGKVIPELMLASNWRRNFAPTAPGNGAVAVRPGHVLLVLNHVQGTTYQVWDPNSGGGQTRVHERNLAGWSFVSPNSSRLAMK